MESSRSATPATDRRTDNERDVSGFCKPRIRVTRPGAFPTTRSTIVSRRSNGSLRQFPSRRQFPIAPANGSSTTSANSTDAAPVQAAPGADPLASMPLWSPGGSPAQWKGALCIRIRRSATRAAQQPQHPRVVATEISPVDDSSKSPLILSRRDALTAFDAKLQNEQPANGGRTEANTAAARGPLIVDGNQPISGAAANPGKPTGEGSSPAPFSSTAPMQIQPRSTPAPLFEPLDDFGPGNDFGPNDKVVGSGMARNERTTGSRGRKHHRSGPRDSTGLAELRACARASLQARGSTCHQLLLQRADQITELPGLCRDAQRRLGRQQFADSLLGRHDRAVIAAAEVFADLAVGGLCQFCGPGTSPACEAD